MANWTTEQLQSFLLFTDNQDMAAINRFMSDTVAVTPKAVQLKDQWIRWWDNLGWYDRNVSTSAFDEARNRRNDFIRANVVSQAEREHVERVIKEGGTTEEMEGGTRRADSTGRFPEEEKPLIPTSVKTVGIIAVIAGAALGVATLVRKFNPASLILGLAKKGD